MARSLNDLRQRLNKATKAVERAQLTLAKAIETRDTILTAFREELVEIAKAGTARLDSGGETA